MVARPLILVLSSLAFAALADAELDLAPRLVELEGEGVVSRHLVFSDGSGKEITYQPPYAWEFSGSPAKLNLHPKGKPLAEATITRQSLPEPKALDEETTKKMTNEALASLPAGSTDVQLLSQEKNPMKIGQNDTFLVTMSYTFVGRPFGRSLMFMNRGNEQLRFQFSSSLDDFAELQRAFLASQYSWQNL